MQKLIDFLKTDWQKYGLITFISTLISSFVAYNTTDRDKSLLEMEAYNKYVTDLVVLHKSPENRLKLAQYFSEVSPSYFSRRQWRKYTEIIIKEKIEFDKKNDSLTVLAIKYEKLKQQGKTSIADSINSVNVEVERIKQSEIKNESLTVPNNVQPEKSIKTIFIQSSEPSINKARNLASKLREMGYSVPSVENMSDDIGTKLNISDSQIRFFNDSDREMAQGIYAISKELIGSSQLVYNPKYSNSKNLEIWIK